MAKKNIIAEFIRHDLEYERRLRIYKNKQGLRGSLLNFVGHVISSAMFYYKDKDATIYRIKEYYNFTENNSYQTK